MMPNTNDRQGLAVEGLVWAFPGSGRPFMEIESLYVPEGKLAVLSGPSGCGKSTLLFLLSTLETPSSGRIFWRGVELSGLSSAGKDRWRREELGMIFQDFELVMELSALENVLLPETFKGLRLSRERKEEAALLLSSLGIRDPGERSRNLSRGEMQRVAFARAVFRSPSIILADEPTASLDRDNEEIIAGLLLEEREKGRAVIVATHQQYLKERADIVFQLEHGHIVEVR